MIASGLMENLISGFTLGLMTGTACFATCGPIYTPFLMQKKLNLFQSVFMILEISAGRFVSYITFGIIAGMLGKSISSFSEHKALFTAIAYFSFSIMLIMSVLTTKKKETGCAVSKWRKYAEAPFLLGVVTGINFCPSFLIALTDAVGMDGPLSGAVLFFGFYMGTNVYLLPLSFFGVLGNQRIFRKIAMVAAVVVGSYFIFKSITISYDLYKHHNDKEIVADVVSVMDESDLYIYHNIEEEISSLVGLLENSRQGKIISITDTAQIGDSCFILVTNSDNESKIDFAKKLVRPGRFVIVLPEIDSLGYSEAYNNKVKNYFSKYFFKPNIEKGTFFSMSRKKSHKTLTSDKSDSLKNDTSEVTDENGVN